MTSTARLTNEVAIITGAADGIGKTIASVFCQHGAKVCVADINETQGTIVAQELCSQGYEAIFVKVDISQSSSVENMVKVTVEQLGSPTILINNAALISVGKEVFDVTDDMWHKNFSVNVDGMWFCSKAVLPYMKQHGRGSIVNVGSVHSFKIVPGYFPYAVTKHAVIGLTRNLAAEFGAFNIRVNALCPGMVETPMAFKSWEACDDPVAARKSIADVHPLKRNASTEEIAYPALFLASQESSFMTGQSLIVDGGRSIIYHD